MTKEEAKKRIGKLKKTINRHRYLYHVKDTQEISDEALDSLKHELKKLEDEFPGLVTPDSPTQRVAGEALGKFKKIEHAIPMLSIEDIFEYEELVSWEAYLKRLSGKKRLSYFCEVKMDGLALSLNYKNGILESAATRGNGQVGEDVTENAKTIESIPLKLEVFGNIKNSGLKNKIESGIQNEFEVRGEVYIAKKDFDKFNRQRGKAGQDQYANPRNLAAGSVRQLDSAFTSSRPLRFMAYDIIAQIAENHLQEHKILGAIGFKTDPTAMECSNIGDIYRYWRDIQKNREKLPYQIDGIIVSVNQNDLFEELGVAGKSPRAIRAFKFAPKQATTVVEDIKVHVGRTGAVTPVAVLRPVEIAGVTVSRATLHNFDEIQRLDVRKGDTVVVERAGDVIPKITKVLKDMRPRGSKKFSNPRTCPQCDAKLQRKQGEVALYCPNLKCPSRKHRYINYFVSRLAFDIEGMGPKVVKKLMDAELISSPADIFTLTEGDVEQLEGFAKKSAQNLIDEINKSKKVTLSRFIISLNIRHVGEETAIDLAREFGSISKLQEASLEKLESIEGIGEVVAGQIYNWFAKYENKQLISDFLKEGVKIIPPARTGTKLKGKTFVFTGSLSGMSRFEAEKKVRELGGSPLGSVSKNTDYVVAGGEPGSKYADAKKLGVKTINEKEFLKLIK
ncbi:MAG: NAD-dependent DNA ligase LigA [Candidatus Spechtbacterales bacterium]